MLPRAAHVTGKQTVSGTHGHFLSGPSQRWALRYIRVFAELYCFIRRNVCNPLLRDVAELRVSAHEHLPG